MENKKLPTEFTKQIILTQSMMFNISQRSKYDFCTNDELINAYHISKQIMLDELSKELSEEDLKIVSDYDYTTNEWMDVERNYFINGILTKKANNN